MNININVNSDIIKGIEKELKRNNIMFLDLEHVPFEVFTVTIRNNITLNTAIERVKSESKAKHLDIFSQIELANKFIQETNNTPEVITYKITKDKLIMTSKDFEIVQNHEGSMSLPCEIKSDVSILSKEFMEEIESYNLLNRQKFIVKLAEHNLTILMTVLHAITKSKSKYEIIEKESTKVKNTKNKITKSNKNKVRYIKTTDINIIKRNINSSNSKHSTYTRHVESWPQRGHWRTYKSGKRVWIKECIKNAKDNSSTNISKTYEIK